MNAPWPKEKEEALRLVEEAVSKMDEEEAFVECEIGSKLHEIYAAVHEAHSILKRRWM